MHFQLALHELLLAATKKKTTTNGSLIYPLLIIVALGVYLWIRPQRKRMRMQQQSQQAIEVGDEIVTASGIIGTVKAMRDDQADIEIAPGTTISVVRRAIGTRVTPRVSPDDVPTDSATDAGASASSTGWSWDSTSEDKPKDDEGHDDPTAASGGTS